MLLNNWIFNMPKNGFRFFPHVIHKNYLVWIIDIIKTKTVKLFAENTQLNLGDLDLWTDVLYMTPEVTSDKREVGIHHKL